MVVTRMAFSAVTWNVYAKTSVEELEPILERLLNDGVTLFLMNEAGGADITRMLDRYDLNTVVFSQWRIAWDPRVWEILGSRRKQTSDATVHGRRGPVKNYFMIARLRHRESGRRLKVISYHTPAHVQRPEWNRQAPNRWEVLKDAMALLRGIFHRSSRHVLAGGDDNVDERFGPKARWRFMLRGLRQIQAPRPTHGRKRKIDDFRIKGLEPVGHGYVGDGGGDHKFFVMRFRFKVKR